VTASTSAGFAIEIGKALAQVDCAFFQPPAADMTVKIVVPTLGNLEVSAMGAAAPWTGGFMLMPDR